MSGGEEKLKNLLENETFWFLIVSVIVLISSTKIACETFPIDPDDSKIILEEDVKRSIPKWITENNLSWMVFFAGSILCVAAYVFSNQTGKNELGVGLLATALTGMLIASIIFDQIIKLFQPKKEKFGSTDDDLGIYYEKIDSIEVFKSAEDSLTGKIDGSDDHPGAIINKTINSEIKVINTKDKQFLLLSKEKNPIQAILKGKGKGYTEDPDGLNSIEGKGDDGNTLLIKAKELLSDGVYYLHAYEGIPELLLNDDGFQIKREKAPTTVYTNDGSGKYTDTGGESLEFPSIAPFKLVIVSTNELDVNMIYGWSVTSIVVLTIGIIAYYPYVKYKNKDIEFFKSPVEIFINIICPLISLIAFAVIISFLKFETETEKRIIEDETKKIHIFGCAIGAYVPRLLQVCYLFVGIQQEYQS